MDASLAVDVVADGLVVAADIAAIVILLLLFLFWLLQLVVACTVAIFAVAIVDIFLMREFVFLAS